MKRPNWNDLYISLQVPQIYVPSLELLQPKNIGRGFLGDITVYLEILKNHDNLLFEAMVIGFDPPTAKIPGLHITDEVEIGIRNFLPGR